MIHETGTTTRNAVHDEHFRFKCAQCANIFTRGDGVGTGYAVRASDDRLICYACCGENDRAELAHAKPGDTFVHYFSDGQVSNWPGTLKIPYRMVRHSRNNRNAPRTDVWFTFAGKNFWGVNVGDNQILRIRALKP